MKRTGYDWVWADVALCESPGVAPVRRWTAFGGASGCSRGPWTSGEGRSDERRVTCAGHVTRIRGGRANEERSGVNPEGREAATRTSGYRRRLIKVVSDGLISHGKWEWVDAFVIV